MVEAADELRHERPPRRPHSIRRRSPALNTVRPLLFAAAVLAAIGWYRDEMSMLLIAAGFVLISGLLSIVIHTGHRRRAEQKQDVLCG